MRPLPKREYVFTTEPRKMTGVFSQQPHNVHFPTKAPLGKFNLGVFRAPARSPVLARMVDVMQRKLRSGRMSNALFYMDAFVDIIRADKRALDGVLRPVAFCPIPVWRSAPAPSLSFGYDAPTIAHIRRHSYGVHLLGPRLKSTWDTLRPQLQ